MQIAAAEVVGERIRRAVRSDLDAGRLKAAGAYRDNYKHTARKQAGKHKQSGKQPGKHLATSVMAAGAGDARRPRFGSDIDSAILDVGPDSVQNAALRIHPSIRFEAGH